MLKSVVNVLNKSISRATWITNLVGVYLIALMMLLVAYDVIARYVFNSPLKGSYELSEYMLGISLAFALAYTGYVKGHIRVELITERFPQKIQLAFERVTLFLSASFVGLLCWRGTVLAQNTLNTNWKSPQLGISNYPFIFLMVFGLALFFLVLLTQFLESFLKR